MAETVDADVPVGEMPPLYLNGIVHDGRLLDDGSGALPFERTQAEFDCLDVSRSWIRFIHRDQRGGGSLDEPVIPGNRRIVELAGDRDGLFLAIERDGDPYALLVPSMEVARFFYMPTTGVARAVFSQALLNPDETIWNGDKSFWDPAGRYLYLQLRKWRRDADARYFAYLYVDAGARAAAREIYAYAAAQAASGRATPGGRLVRAVPPVDGELATRYRYIPFQSGGRQRRLITRILSAHFPVPFEELEWGRDADGRSTADRDEAPSTVRETPPWREHAEFDQDAIPVGPTPQRPDTPPERIAYQESDARFPGLYCPPAKKVGKTSQQTKSETKPPQRSATDSATTYAARAKDARSHRTFLEPEIGREPTQRRLDEGQVGPTSGDRFDRLIETLQALGTLEHVSVRFLDLLPWRFDMNGIIYGAFPAKYSVDRSDQTPYGGAWFFTGAGGRLRLVVVAQVSVRMEAGTQHLYLIDMQARKEKLNSMLMLRSTDGPALSREDLQDVLVRCAARRKLKIAKRGVVARSHKHTHRITDPNRPAGLLEALRRKLEPREVTHA